MLIQMNKQKANKIFYPNLEEKKEWIRKAMKPILQM